MYTNHVGFDAYRCAWVGAGGPVPTQAAAVLRGVRLPGPRGGPEGEGDEAQHTQ